VPSAVVVDHIGIELVRARRCLVLGAGVSAFWGSEGRVPCMPEVKVEFAAFKETRVEREGG
jgi:hypothetical protein